MYDVLENRSAVNRDWSALRETWTAKILECFDMDIEDQSNKKKSLIWPNDLYYWACVGLT